MIALPLLLAVSVTLEPAFVPCRPAWGAGAWVVEGKNDGDAREVSVELMDSLGHLAIVELDLPTRSHKRLVAMPPLWGRVSATVVEDGVRTSLSLPLRPECAQAATVVALERDDGRTGLTLPEEVSGRRLDIGRIRREDLTGSWRALEVLDVIAAEARALHELSDAEFQALRSWTMGGGVLLVVPGIDPGPLARSGRLPPALDLLAPPGALRWGGGWLIAGDPASGDAALGNAIGAAAAERGWWREAIGRIFDRQRDRSGPAGRASDPAGMLILGSLLLAAAAAHEVLRRRYIAGARDFDRYFRGLAIVLGLSAVSGAVAAAGTRSPSRAGTVMVVGRGSGSALRSEAHVLGPGKARDVAADAWIFMTREIRVVLGRRHAAVNASSGARAFLERRPAHLGGTIEVVRTNGIPTAIVDATPLSFSPGWLVEATGCRPVPPLASGTSEAVGARERCPASVTIDAAIGATVGGRSWYVADADGVPHLVLLESP